MFGYVRVCKDELKVREFNLFRSYYCGLCKTLKREYGFISRMGLSYDVTFLALLLSSVSEEKVKIRPERCIANPFRSKPVCLSSGYLDYTAAANVMLMYAKLADDWQDERSLRSLFCMPLFYPAKRKAKKRYDGLFAEISLHLRRLSELEKEKCSEIDRLAHEFGMVMRAVFDVPFFEENQRRVFSHIGYCLGRYIYILDAYEDRAKDQKTKSFNPFLISEEKNDEQAIKTALLFTLSDVSNSYQLLDIKANKAILDNIIYLGLQDSLDKVFCKPCQGEKAEGEKINEGSV